MSPSLAIRPIAFVALIIMVATTPAEANRSYRSKLDTEGKAIGAAWATTPRFDGLTAAGQDDVRMVRGEKWQIRALGDAAAVAQLRFLVEDGSLIVGRVSHRPTRYGKAVVEVTAPSLRMLTAAGSGDVQVERLSGERTMATLAGSGRATIDRIESRRLDATVAGSGDLVLSGRSERTSVTIAGSGKLAAPSFTTGSSHITVAGSGSARFRSSGPVAATIAGSGTVHVVGTIDCTQARIGSGRLICAR